MACGRPMNNGHMARRPPQTRYAQSSGANIAYQVSGTGPPDLVMVPGLVSHLDIQWQQTAYRRFVRTLEQGARVIRLDKRGTGLSDPARELATIEERVQDLAAVMAAARSSCAVLFGMSDGGRAAIAFAAAYPGRTQGLILYGTSYRGPRAALLRRYRSVVRHWGEGRLAGLVAPSMTGPQARHAAGAFERAAASPAMAAALIESLGLIDVRDHRGISRARGEAAACTGRGTGAGAPGDRRQDSPDQGLGETPHRSSPARSTCPASKTPGPRTLKTRAPAVLQAARAQRRSAGSAGA